MIMLLIKAKCLLVRLNNIKKDHLLERLNRSHLFKNTRGIHPHLSWFQNGRNLAKVKTADLKKNQYTTLRSIMKKKFQNNLQKDYYK